MPKFFLFSSFQNDGWPPCWISSWPQVQEPLLSRPPSWILSENQKMMCGIVDTYNRKLYKKFHAIIWNRSWTAGIKRKSKMAAAGRHLGFHLKIKKWCVELLILIIGSCTRNFTQLSETVPELQVLKENPRWRPAAILDFIWKSKNDVWNCWYL